jgi:hypothetical protein
LAREARPVKPISAGRLPLSKASKAQKNTSPGVFFVAARGAFTLNRVDTRPSLPYHRSRSGQ